MQVAGETNQKASKGINKRGKNRDFSYQWEW